jgi:epoxyqueuosine reductase
MARSNPPLGSAFVAEFARKLQWKGAELTLPLSWIEQNLSGWLYGCDICQDVCPWNRFEQKTEEARFVAREGNANTSLSDILELTPETYAERFRGSAMKRAKLAGLQRNARALLNIR